MSNIVDKVFDNSEDGKPNYAIDLVDGTRLYARGKVLNPMPQSGDAINFTVVNVKTSKGGNPYTNVKDVSNVAVLYRYKKASSQENFEDIDWVYFNNSGEPDSLEVATSENNISGIVEKQSAYQELKFSASDLPEFSSFAVKVVMKSVDPSYVPKIQDIRAVASF